MIGFMGREILRASVAASVIYSYSDYDIQSMKNSLRARYLETRTFTDPWDGNDFTTDLQDTVDDLLRAIRRPTNQVRLKYIRVLCAAAASCLGVGIVEQLDRGEQSDALSVSTHDANEDDENLFVAAAHVGNALLLQQMIEEGVDIDAQSQYFGGALRGAAFGGHLDAVLLLLNCGAGASADLASTDDSGRQARIASCKSTALQAAALGGHEHVVRLLLEPKYHVCALGYEYERAILFAVRGGHLCLVRFLMDNAKTLHPKHLQHWILLKASYYGHEPIVQMMLDLGTNARWDDNEDESPLLLAASQNFHNIVQLLLARGADPNMGGKYEQETPLYEAVRRGHERVAKTLLDHGANINAGFFNPLDAAVRSGTLHMVRLLLERGAALDTIYHASNAILSSAAWRGHEPMVRLLVKFGARVDAEPNQAMLDAMRAGHDHVVNTLIGFGAKKIHPLQTIYANEFASGRYPLRKSPYTADVQ